MSASPKSPPQLAVVSQFLRTMLLSYGVLTFSAHPVPATLVLLASFFHPVVGVMGLIGNFISNLIARWMGANRQVWNAGIFGVSGILVGLALGMYSDPTPRMWVFLIFGAAFSGVVSILLGTYLAKSDLPILSMPFMMVIWPILLTVGVARGSTSLFPSVGLLRGMDQWVFDQLPLACFQFVKMFGSILFQENLISGVLVLLAIGLYSRLSLLYAAWGGLLGIVTYVFLHGSIDGFHGLNFALIALAFGGFFLVSNLHCLLITSLAIVAVGIVDLATRSLLVSLAHSPQDSLPSLVFAFNVVTIMFLYPLKKAALSQEPRRLIPVPLSVIKSPEANLRWMKRWIGRRFQQKTILTFPFMGTWSVLQGNNGEWTHKATGRFAWDYVIRDREGSQTKGLGTQLSDYYAFGLPVLAPAPGMMYMVENHVEDNPPRTAVTERNWGNYVVIDHWNGEYSELSHFKKGSIVVVPGQRVVRGQLLGYCGNSGRSPAPHIHFQLQANPAMGSPTLPARFAEGILNKEIHLNLNPDAGDTVSPVEIDSEAEWTLLGKESEQWTFHCKMGLWRFKETLSFTTDAFGYPAIASKNHYLWYLIDNPNFLEIIPDFKTFPSLLSPSGWMKIVGESLILPKKLNRSLRWSGGKVSESTNNLWVIESQGRQITIDPQIETIKEIKIGGDPSFLFRLETTSRLSK